MRSVIILLCSCIMCPCINERVRGFHTHTNYKIFSRTIHVGLSPKVVLMDFWHRIIISTVRLNSELILSASNVDGDGDVWRRWIAVVRKKKSHFAHNSSTFVLQHFDSIENCRFSDSFLSFFLLLYIIIVLKYTSMLLLRCFRMIMLTYYVFSFNKHVKTMAVTFACIHFTKVNIFKKIFLIVNNRATKGTYILFDNELLCISSHSSYFIKL